MTTTRMTETETRELILACRDLAGMHTDDDLLAMLDDHDDPSMLADMILDGSIETDADDEIDSPLDRDFDLAQMILRAMLELRFNQIDR